MVFWVFFPFFTSSGVFCHCIVFCLLLSVCLFATHVVNKDLYIMSYTNEGDWNTMLPRGQIDGIRPSDL